MGLNPSAVNAASRPPGGAASRPRERDLGAQPPRRVIRALVVCREQEDEPVAVRVAEDPEQDPTSLLPRMKTAKGVG
jgi:hypothetical protein